MAMYVMPIFSLQRSTMNLDGVGPQNKSASSAREMCLVVGSFPFLATTIPRQGLVVPSSFSNVARTGVTLAFPSGETRCGPPGARRSGFSAFARSVKYAFRSNSSFFHFLKELAGSP
jgi:hypothetical protein